MITVRRNHFQTFRSSVGASAQAPGEKMLVCDLKIPLLRATWVLIYNIYICVVIQNEPRGATWCEFVWWIPLCLPYIPQTQHLYLSPLHRLLDRSPLAKFVMLQLFNTPCLTHNLPQCQTEEASRGLKVFLCGHGCLWRLFLERKKVTS